MKIALFCAVTGTCLLAGCSDPEFAGRPGLNTIQQGNLPEPERGDITIPPRPYALGPADQLAIDVFGSPELSVREVTVDIAGRISVPMVGSILVSGMTAEELERAIADKLRQSYVRDPRVSVNITAAASQSITVDGAVTTPGNYAMSGRMSLMRAIARAQGVTEFARENYVVVFRHAAGQDYAALYDLRAIRQGMYPDPEIFSNDIVFVGDSNARRLFKDIVSTLPVLAAPLIAITR